MTLALLAMSTAVQLVSVLDLPYNNDAPLLTTPSASVEHLLDVAQQAAAKQMPI